MNHFVQKGNKISIERSKVTRRTKRSFNLNLKRKSFKTKLSGNFHSFVRNNTMKTINKYENIEDYAERLKKIGLMQDFVDTLTPVEKALLLLKRGQLTERAKKIRKTLINTSKKVQIQMLSKNQI